MNGDADPIVSNQDGNGPANAPAIPANLAPMLDGYVQGLARAEQVGGAGNQGARREMNQDDMRLLAQIVMRSR